MPLPTTRYLYNARAPTYDTTWHPLHAAAYLQWTSPLPGTHILDLACGTGLVALLAKPVVGPSGSVTGVDISNGMLDVARHKVQSQNLDVGFVEADVCDVDGLIATGIKERGYDLITCATALVLLQDPGIAVKDWTRRLLRKGGTLIADVPVKDSLLAGLVLEEVQRKLGIPVPYYRTWATSLQSLVRLFEDAGLEIERAWEVEGYVGSKEYAAEDGREVFEKMIGGEGGAMRSLVDEDRIEEVKERFMERWRERGDADGRVREGDGFWIVIGRKA